jgi:predicted aldo/keto reductase-like oxidoreductase
MCGACSGQCPKGLPIGDMLRILTYADGYGQFPMARDNYLALPATARNVRCNDCSTCPVHCPHGVRVRERLTLAQTWLA